MFLARARLFRILSLRFSRSSGDVLNIFGSGSSWAFFLALCLAILARPEALRRGTHWRRVAALLAAGDCLGGCVVHGCEEGGSGCAAGREELSPCQHGDGSLSL